MISEIVGPIVSSIIRGIVSARGAFGDGGGNYLLLESGDRLLLESGDGILLEA